MGISIRVLLLSFLIGGSLSAMCQKPGDKQSSVSIRCILKGDYHRYIGKEVQEFLMDVNIKDYKSYTFIHEPPLVLRGVLLEIKEDFYIEVIVENYKYLEQFNGDLNWNFTSFKKEEISAIRFVKNEKLKLSVK